MPDTGPEAEAVVAGNEVGTTGARRCALPLCPAHLCAGFRCGNRKVPWWRGCGCIPGGQGVAGSNPAVPTGNRVFSNIVTPLKSQQRANLLCNGPPANRVPRRPYRACANTAEPTKAHSQGVKGSLRHLGIRTATPATANRPAPSPAAPVTASRSLTALQQLHDAGQAWAPKPSLPTPLPVLPSLADRWRGRWGHHGGLPCQNRPRSSTNSACPSRPVPSSFPGHFRAEVRGSAGAGSTNRQRTASPGTGSV